MINSFTLYFQIAINVTKSGPNTASLSLSISSVSGTVVTASVGIPTTTAPPPPPPPLNMCIIINILHYLKPFSKVLILAEPIDGIGTEAERAAFLSLKFILNQLSNNNIIINNILQRDKDRENNRDIGKDSFKDKDPEPINIYPFLDKFCSVTNSNFHRFEELDVGFVWDSIVKLITTVIPPLRRVFYGCNTNAIGASTLSGANTSPNLMNTPWLSPLSRCFHAQFEQNIQSLEEVLRGTLTVGSPTTSPGSGSPAESDTLTPLVLTPSTTASTIATMAKQRIKESNYNILKRDPDILVFVVESSYLPHQLNTLLQQAADMGSSPSTSRSAAASSSSSKAPNLISGVKPSNPAAIRFPQSFSLTALQPPNVIKDNTSLRIYDLTSIISLEGANFETVQAYYRVFESDQCSADDDDDDDSAEEHTKDSNGVNVKWFKGSGPHHEEVEEYKMIERNCFSSCDTKSKNRVHPRLLIYVRQDFADIFDRFSTQVSKAGQLRALGDIAFDLAKLPEHYDEAKQYYDMAMQNDDGSLKVSLQSRLQELDQIERNQRALCYENQGDTSLFKRRYKEACDLYKIAMRSIAGTAAIGGVNGNSVNSIQLANLLYQRIREKEDLALKIIALEIANHLAEKGEDCLKNGSLPHAKEQFSQALKLNQDYIHLQLIVTGIERSITLQSSGQKINEASQAMKVGKYRLANQLFLEAVSLVPEKHENLKPVLDGLVVLMQGEDALIKQRSGLVALEDKKYSLAISLITEAIGLLPTESISEHAFFLCDRASVHFELKDYQTSIADCQAALVLRPDLAIGFLRLGSAQFELELYDDAIFSYEKAIKFDTSLSEQVKVKLRQVNSAKEVLKRKEREAERAKAKEEERRLLEEKRAREEQVKKEKAEKLAHEQLEKAERNRLKEEERQTRALIEKEQQSIREKNKEAEKERLRLEKLERDAQRAAERERARAEKERERERLRLEKEQKLMEERQAQQQEEKRHREIQQEIERAEAKIREAKREKEAETEKARLEREKVIAEREKVRNEKLQLEAKKIKVAAESSIGSNPSSSSTAAAPTAGGSTVGSSGSSQSAISSATDSNASSGSTADAAPTAKKSAVTGKVVDITATTTFFISSPADATASVQTPSTALESAGVSGPITASRKNVTAIVPNVVPGTAVGSNKIWPTAILPKKLNPESGVANATGATKWVQVIATGLNSDEADTVVNTMSLPPLAHTVRTTLDEFPSLKDTLQPSTSSSASITIGGESPFPKVASVAPGSFRAAASLVESDTISSAWADHQRAMLEATADSLASLDLSSSNKSAASPRATAENESKSSSSSDIVQKTSGAMAAPQEPDIDENRGQISNDVIAIDVDSPAISLSVSESKKDDVVSNSQVAELPNQGVTLSNEALRDVVTANPVPVESTVDFIDFNAYSDMLDSDLNLNVLNLEFEGDSYSNETAFANDVLGDSQLVSNSLLSNLSIGGIMSGYSSNNTGLLSLNPIEPTLMNSMSYTTNSSTSASAGNSSAGQVLGESANSSPRVSSTQHSAISNSMGGLNFSSTNNDRYFMDILGPSDPMHYEGHSLNLNAIHDYNLSGDDMGYLMDGMLGSSGIDSDSRGGFNSFAHESMLNGKDLVDDGILQRRSDEKESDFGSFLHEPLGHSYPFNLSRGSTRSSISDNLSQDMSSLGGGYQSFNMSHKSSGQHGMYSNGPLSSSFRPLPHQSQTQYLSTILDHNSADFSSSSPNSPHYPYLVQSGNRQNRLATSYGGSTSNSLSISNQLSVAPSSSFANSSSRINGGSSNAIGLGLGIGGNVGNMSHVQMSLSRPSTVSPNIMLSTQTPPPIQLPLQTTAVGIDADIMPESAFPSVTWLRTYRMHMYMWAGDTKEWTEYAMHLPSEFLHIFLGNDALIKISDVIRISGCEVWISEEMLEGRAEKFIVFKRGYSGQPSNSAMNVALDLISASLKQYFSTLSAGVSSHLPKPPSSSMLLNNIGGSSNLGNTFVPNLTAFPALTSSNPITNPTPVEQSGKLNTSWQNIVSSFASAGHKSSSTSTLASSLSALTSSVGDSLDFTIDSSLVDLQQSDKDLASNPFSLSSIIRGPKKDRPEPLRIPVSASGYVQRSLEIPREVVGLIIGQAGKKIKELCSESGAKIQFRVNKTAEREGRPGLLEVQGSKENVDMGLQLIWDLLQMLGKEYVEVPFQSSLPRTK